MKFWIMRSIKLPVAIILILLYITSCGKIEKLPPEPSITFKSFEIFDSVDNLLGNKEKAGRLIFHFQDGDGDLGLPRSPEPVAGVDTVNLFFTLLRKTGNIFQEVANNDPLKPLSFRIPFMDRQGQNKILSGNISVTFLYLYYYPTDTIKYKFFVKDRLLHSSNTDSTCVIVLTKNGICSN
jgi:hypothetical protein